MKKPKPTKPTYMLWANDALCEETAGCLGVGSFRTKKAALEKCRELEAKRYGEDADPDDINERCFVTRVGGALNDPATHWFDDQDHGEGCAPDRAKRQRDAAITEGFCLNVGFEYQWFPTVRETLEHAVVRIEELEHVLAELPAPPSRVVDVPDGIDIGDITRPAPGRAYPAPPLPRRMAKIGRWFTSWGEEK